MKLWCYTSALLVLSFGLFTTALADVYQMPTQGNDIVGETFTVRAQRGDNLIRLANRYNIGLHEIREANPDIRATRRLHVGKQIFIPKQFILPPKPRTGIVINMAELRLYYYSPDGQFVFTYPVALGREGWRSPIMKTTVQRKQRNPIWFIPESIREETYLKSGKILPKKIMPGPDNPLGHYALYLGKRGYLIHGNNAEWSVGRLISSGCIRLHNTDIKELFDRVPVGTPVRIVHLAQKAGWLNAHLYLESHLPVRLYELEDEMNHNSYDVAIAGATRHRTADIDWNRVKHSTHASRGIPVPIGDEA